MIYLYKVLEQVKLTYSDRDQKGIDIYWKRTRGKVLERWKFWSRWTPPS